MKSAHLCIILFISFCAPLSILAQNKVALGCDGKRYLQDIFTDTTRTVVQFGNNKKLSGANQDLFMDIVEPKGDTLKKRPVIIFAFGGGFIGGERSSMNLFCQSFAKKGYVCATIDYRIINLLELGRLPDSLDIAKIGTQAMQDMKAAIRFFRKDAATVNKYKIDPDNIIAGGVSAGAISAMLVGHLDSADVIADFYRNAVIAQGGYEGNSGNPNYDSSVKAVINMSGGLYRKEIIDRNDPPFINYHGTVDDVVPYGFGKNVYGFFNDGSGTCFGQARSVGVPSVLYTVRGGGHENIYPVTTQTYLADFIKFSTALVVFAKQVVCGDPILTISPTNDIATTEISVFPNPSSDVMQLDWAQNTAQSERNTEGSRFDISITDLAGRTVYQARNAPKSIIAISKSQTGSGMFILKIKAHDTGAYWVKKIVFN